MFIKFWRAHFFNFVTPQILFTPKTQFLRQNISYVKILIRQNYFTPKFWRKSVFGVKIIFGVNITHMFSIFTPKIIFTTKKHSFLRQNIFTPKTF